MKPTVIYEEKDFIALDKPAGLLVHPVTHNVELITHNSEATSSKARVPSEEPTLAGWLLEHYPEVRAVGDKPEVRPGIVHRLDKGTSGIMLIPRTQGYFEYLKSLFQEHEVRKTYWAVVYGKPKAPLGRIDRPIGLSDGGIKRSLHAKKLRKSAVTNYALRESWTVEDKEVSLLEVAPETGRTHQIRVHVASIGHPIVGDLLYGPKRQPAWATTRLMLHAFSIEWSVFPGKKLKLTVDPPSEFLLPPI